MILKKYYYSKQPVSVILFNNEAIENEMIDDNEMIMSKILK